MTADMRESCRIGLIGCGNMGGALLRGWLAAGVVAMAAVLDPHTVSVDPAGVDVQVFKTAEDFIAADAAIDVVVLAVKPQTLATACAAIGAAVPRDALVLSIAAGKTLATIAALFPDGQPVIRAMPNTPASIGRGITGLVAGPAAGAAHRRLAEMLLAVAGAVEWLNDEAMLDALTAISGSGPAYLFHFIEALAAAGATLGLPPEMAMRLARQTVIGSAALADAEPTVPAATLRRNVTSPNGTTEAALDVLMDGRWQQLIDAATDAAARRAHELSK